MIRIGRGPLVVCVLILLFFVPSILSYRRESQPNEPCKMIYTTTVGIHIFLNAININVDSIQIPEKYCLTMHFFGYVYNLNITSRYLVLDSKFNNSVQTIQISTPSQLADVTFDPPEYHSDFSVVFESINYNSTGSIKVIVGKGSVYYDTINFAYYIFLAGMIRYVIVREYYSKSDEIHE